jgi:hypothetical protein
LTYAVLLTNPAELGGSPLFCISARLTAVDSAASCVGVSPSVGRCGVWLDKILGATEGAATQDTQFINHLLKREAVRDRARPEQNASLNNGEFAHLPGVAP